MKPSAFPELRERCYVDALRAMQRDNNVLGYFGTLEDEGLIRKYGLLPVPIEGLDPHIFQYGEAKGCDVIRSTLIYLKTMKCPLLFSSKAFITDGSCPAFDEALKKSTEKPMAVISGEKNLRDFLESLSEEFSDDTEIDNLLASCEQYKEKIRQSNLTAEELFNIEFYSRFLLDLEERRDILRNTAKDLAGNRRRQDFPVTCPGGIVPYLEEKTSRELRITIDKANPVVTCPGCIYTAEKYVNYRGGNYDDKS